MFKYCILTDIKSPTKKQQINPTKGYQKPTITLQVITETKYNKTPQTHINKKKIKIHKMQR